jgi:hypothetical protein
MWHKIEDSNYEVSNLGEVRHINTKQIKKLHSGGTSKYLMVQVYVGNNKRKSYLVHRLVAKYFIDNPNNKEQVNHIDGNKMNNCYHNLEWVTPKENMAHAIKTGLYNRYNNQTYKNKFGAQHNRSIKIECNGIVYNGYSEASRLTNIKVSTIHRAVKYNRPCKGMYFKLH